jgi:putative transposase
MYLADVPAHVVQRGNNRRATFFCDDDFLYYRRRLAEGLKRFRVALHAYVLMTNHVHLLMTPQDRGGISQVMQHLGRIYVLHVNRAYRRTGTLWEGRHKASLVCAGEYLLTCMRYIESNPVAAGMVESPELYRWSSYHANAWGEADELLTEHPVFLRLGETDKDRQRNYRALFDSPVADDDVKLIGQSLAFNYPLGNDRFRNEIECALGLKIGHCRRGRPIKKGSE